MRILQVVTYISPDGAYGGPVRVALNQSKALTGLGHEVTLAAAAGGFKGKLPEEFDGFPVELFTGWKILPKAGFAGLVSPSLLKWLTKAIRTADVVHVHMARDLITLPAAAMALLTGKPLIVQTHGMVAKSTNPLSGPLDRILTVPVLRKASKVLFLTGREQDDIVEIAGGNCRLHELVNGVEIGNFLAREQQDGPSVRPEVLYLARLHPRKRARLFAEMAVQLAPRWPNVRWSLVGPDEGEGAQVKEIITQHELMDSIGWEGALSPDRTLTRMRNASIYVLPAIHEPFGMTVIEAMSIGLPVVVTESCGLAEFVRDNHAGIVCDDSQDGLRQAVETLLEDSNLRASMGRNALHAVRCNFSMDKVALILLGLYEQLKISEKDRA